MNTKAIMDPKTQLVATYGDQVRLTTWSFVAWQMIGAKNTAELKEALHDLSTTGSWQMETRKGTISFSLA